MKRTRANTSEPEALPLFDGLAGARTSAIPSPGLFPPIPPVRLRDPRVRGTVEEVRLSKQCREILDRLRKGPASNKELAGIALNYRARISDLRGAGYEIELAEYQDVSGRGMYELREK